jgi:NADPH2:quinone reductase
VGQREYPYVPGNEISGEVIEVGSSVTDFSLGDRVFGAPLNGAMRSECLVEASRVHRIPEGVSPDVCAGFELNYGTAYHSLYDLAQMQPGERVLVLGASGGVGMAGIDLAVAAGCEVVACASSAEKLQACKEAGASILINYETDAGGDFKQALRDAGVYPLIDIVLDPVGGKWSETGVRSLRWGGRLVVVGFASGSTVPKEGIAKIPLNLALLNERKILVRHVVAKRC